ncbi:adenylate/guanylate cyclase domain-containing protein [Trichothermofontia sp.]
MHPDDPSLLLRPIAPRLRSLLPPELYIAAWMDQSPEVVMQVFEHLRALQWILHDYVPRQVAQSPPLPGQLRWEWQEGTLLFTDLAGFTPLMEANARCGQVGIKAMLTQLNTYFTAMIEILSKSGGNLLEFTGDAMLAQFPADSQHQDIKRAIRAGLRMQRAMAQFTDLPIAGGVYTLQMRVGIHRGRFLRADIGTPLRMEHVLLGRSVQLAKGCEGNGQVGRVCLSAATAQQVEGLFRFDSWRPGYCLVRDDLSPEQLGEYDMVPSRRRAASNILFDRSPAAIVSAITETLDQLEPLACYLPSTLLTHVVEHTANRQLPPQFTTPTVAFVSIRGLSEQADLTTPESLPLLIQSFSRLFALINAAAESQGGILKKITYHLAGSDMMIYFGIPHYYSDNSQRAATAMLTIRTLIQNTLTPLPANPTPALTCQIGIAQGPVFAAEIGEPRGRREFNVLGDAVNTAARLMGRASPNQILLTESVYHAVADRFATTPLGKLALKGKSQPLEVFELNPLPD